MKRRALITGAVAASPSVFAVPKKGTEHRVAIIGHTGRGNFGHGLDKVWTRIPGTEIAGLADANTQGLASALKRLKLPNDRGFSDYRKMLQSVRPEFVSVCPRHADQHRDICLAAMKAGAKGIYVEKPFCRTPEEADELVAACDRYGTKIAVAHRNRYHPALAVIDNLIADGRIGRLLEIRGRGKGDRRGGAEDLWVLGTHVLNLIHYFGGEPGSCSALMLADGEPVTRSHIIEGSEGLGPLAGNEVHARYVLSGGLVATFDSIANDGTGGAGFGLQLVGSEGIVNLQCDRDPVAYLVPGNPFRPSGKPRHWIPITSAGVGAEESHPKLIADVQNHDQAVRDLVDACAHDRRPLCDVRQGALTVEMVCAVFASHQRNGEAVSFPLKERGNPLSRWTEG